MATFTIDIENNITAHAALPAGADESQSFSTAKELVKLTAEWPASRLVDTWNSFAGVAPFDDLKPVKRQARKSPAKAAGRTRAQKGANEAATNKKAEVIAMMKRAKGATLAEIVEATGWQKHTVRGFVSILGSKGGQKIESSKNAAGERSYRIAK